MAAITFNAAVEGERAPLLRSRKGRHPEVEGNQPAKRLFVRLAPDILNETIPAFFIGRNAEGLWVARELKGRAGGLFFLKSSAISFARRRAGQIGCATIFPAGMFELDIKNEGNPLIDYTHQLLRTVARLRQHLGEREASRARSKQTL
jgi:hypothetical protein